MKQKENITSGALSLEDQEEKNVSMNQPTEDQPLADQPIVATDSKSYTYPYDVHQYGDESEVIESVPEGSEVFAGAALPAGCKLASQDEVENSLREVYDPEIPVNIYDLGLIYEVRMEKNGDVSIAMTLTAPACPVAGELPQEVADQVASVSGVGCVCVRITWEPAWNPSLMSEEARMALDFF